MAKILMAVLAGVMVIVAVKTLAGIAFARASWRVIRGRKRW